MNEKIKVIHFLESENLKNCIDLGYLGNENEWNPSGEIMLYPYSRWEELKEEGIKFKRNPYLDTEGEATFLRSPDDSSLFIPSNEYVDTVIPDKEDAIITVLKHLGIHEYYIHTFVKGEIGIGGKKEKTVGAEGSAPLNGVPTGLEGGYNSSKNGGTGLKLKKFEAQWHTFNNKDYVLNEESWKQARKLAKQYGLDKEKFVAAMLEWRKPDSSKNYLEASHKYLNFTGEIRANFNIAKSLNMLAKVPGIASIGSSFSKLFNFEANAQLEYQTLVIYNFSKEKALEKLKQQVIDLGGEI